MVMHARKPQRVNDGYFEKHQTHPYQSSKYNSKRDYEREASRSSFVRERDLSPGGGPLNNGNSSYRSVSPDLDSPRDKDRDRDRDRDRYQSSSYMQKMRDRNDRDRDSYKKDKYSSECLRSPKDKRDRRDRESEHRTNHDRIEMNRSRSSKLCSQTSSDKRGGSSSNSDDRDRERDRDRDRVDRDRVNRIGDWSEHVSSSGKKYYYNCKTEVSQWEKPREWLEKERLLTKELHREYRERERDREREDRFSSRSSYGKHSNSRGSSRIRWPHDTDVPSSTHRRRHEADSQDMDISPGDSTPTSEASYSHSSTPTTNLQNNNDGPVLLATVLPRLSSHPSTPTNSQLHFTTPSSVSLNTTLTSCTPSSLNQQQQQQQNQQQQQQLNSGNNLINVSGNNNLSHQITKLVKNDGGGSGAGVCVGNQHATNLPALSPSSASGNLGGNITSGGGQTESVLNSNAPGPPVTLASLPKILSQITGNKTIDQSDINPQKALQTINNALLMSSRQQIGNDSNHTNNGTNSLREHTLNSPLYNLSHLHSMSIINHSSGSPYVSGAGSNSILVTEGPPTPTQELDVIDHRKLIEGASATLSSLQGVSSQVARSQGPSLTPSLANYFRADLISHVTGWPADLLETQAQKCSEDAHILGDLQCTRVSAELKIARSLVRITEITATLQEQKVMYLRQQIRRLEELKSQNSFMSDDL